MLHLRLTVPADRTDEVLQLLERTVGTTRLPWMSFVAAFLAGVAGTLTLATQKLLWARHGTLPVAG
ncbi:hypothetical protein [Streptomyces platensis]